MEGSVDDIILDGEHGNKLSIKGVLLGDYKQIKSILE
jgi:hypothetical protein